MKPETKVVLLFLSLICLIIVCVYTHVDTIKIGNQEVKKEEPSSALILEDSKDDVAKEIPSKALVNEEDRSFEAVEEEIPVEEEVIKPIDKNKEENSESVVEVEEDKPLDKEIKKEPLITINPKYIREGEEKRIEELSMKSQSLQIEINNFIKNNPILFKRASYKVTKQSDKVIDKIVEILKNNPNLIIEIAGHTDAVGAKEVNEAISLGRAKSVLRTLVKFGIDENRLKARGYGPRIPLVKNSPNGYSKINRRVEFNIIGE